MLQQVLPIARAVFHPSHHAHQLVIHVGYAQIYTCTLSHLVDFLLYLAACLGHHLFDTGWMDAPIGHQFVQRQAGYLPPHGIEATDDNGVGRIVDDDFHPCQTLEGAYVAPFASDDASLYFLILKVKHAHRILYCALGGRALYALHHYLFGLLVGRDFSLLHDVHYRRAGLCPCLVGHRVHQLLLCLFGTQSSYVLQLLHALFIHLLHLGLSHVQRLNLFVQVVAHPLQLVVLLLQLVHLLRQRLFSLFQLILALAKLVVLFVDALVVFTLHLQILLFRLQYLVFLDDFAFLFGIFKHLLALRQQLVA